MAALRRGDCLPWVHLPGPPSGRSSRSPTSATNAPSLLPNSPTSTRRVWPSSLPRPLLAVETGGNERRNLLFDKLLDLRRVEHLDERPQPRIVLLVLPCSEAQHEAVVDGAIDDQCRFRVAARRDQIGDIDQCERDVIERAVSLRRIEFDDLQVLGVFDDVEFADRESLARRELDQAGTFEQDQPAGAVQRLVRNRNAVTGLDLFELLDLLREQSDRGDHADLVDLHEVESTLLVLKRQIGPVLE